MLSLAFHAAVMPPIAIWPLTLFFHARHVFRHAITFRFFFSLYSYLLLRAATPLMVALQAFMPILPPMLYRQTEYIIYIVSREIKNTVFFATIIFADAPFIATDVFAFHADAALLPTAADYAGAYA